MDGARRQADGLAELAQRPADIVLEQVQQVEVDLVKRYRARAVQRNNIASRRDRFQSALRTRRLASSSTTKVETEGGRMITGVHAIVFSKDAEGVRELFQDVFGFPSVDAGDGWLIFGLPPAELAAHPTEGADHHELYLMCDDVHATVEELKARGVQLAHPVRDEAFGLLTAIVLPGGGELGLYEPRHPSPITPSV
jgi:Glyoxalase/Bleomycin resistance protein/Dioxygenase superfamily